jgi:hypothetical protein
MRKVRVDYSCRSATTGVQTAEWPRKRSRMPQDCRAAREAGHGPVPWYSSLMPFPPSMSRASRAMASDLPQELRLTMEIISGGNSSLVRASFCRPTCQVAQGLGQWTSRHGTREGVNSSWGVRVRMCERKGVSVMGRVNKHEGPRGKDRVGWCERE